MNYAIIEIGGAQQKVSPGDLIRVNKLADAEQGKPFAIDRVLLVRAEGALRVGAPTVEGAVVKATVIGDIKGKKVLIFKKKKRKQYRRTRGHRQQYTTLRIVAIEGIEGIEA
ncbi:MAG TPA: 50S ribosomal protein L21 [Candidatus Polarisedimenticolia bacterium]|nr:50S ribosomal protein L21 [Candidatus Polarisedimenticolia bacterium]